MNTRTTKTIEITDPRSWIIKISLGTIAVLGLVLLISFQWGRALLDTVFLTDAAWAADKLAMQEQLSVMKTEQSSQGVLLTSLSVDVGALSKNIQLADAVSTYRNAEQAFYLHQLDEERNGVTSRSSVRRRELKSELDESKEFRDCVLNERPNCEAIRPK